MLSALFFFLIMFVGGAFAFSFHDWMKEARERKKWGQYILYLFGASLSLLIFAYGAMPFLLGMLMLAGHDVSLTIN